MKPLTAHEMGSAILLFAGGSLCAFGLAGILSLLPGGRADDEAVRSLLISVPPGWRLICFAVAPALFEETLFRGALLGSIRGWGAGWASAASGIAFAAVHGSWIKFLPVAVLGWTLAQIVFRTGNFWLAVAGHALHNGLVLGVVSFGMEGDGASLPLSGVILAAGILTLWIAICRAGTSEPRAVRSRS